MTKRFIFDRVQYFLKFLGYLGWLLWGKFNQLPRWVRAAITVALVLLLAFKPIWQFVTQPRPMRLVNTPKDSTAIYSAKGKDIQIDIGDKEATGSPKIVARVSTDDFVSFVLTEATGSAKPEKKGNKVVYKDARKDVDLTYETLVNGIKEEIIVKKPQKGNAFTFHLETKGAVMRSYLAGFYLPVFYDAEGEYLYHIEKPFAVDANGNRNDDVILQIQKDDAEKTFARIILDQGWLDSAAYPITIDPTIVHDTSSEFATGTMNRTKDTGQGATGAATGGTITTSGGYTIHTFTSSGTFTPTTSMNVEYLVVAGGGGGGSSVDSQGGGGGGGAGGVVYNSSYAVTNQAYTVTVGNGGAGGAINAGQKGSNGQNSVFGSVTATGGGGGGSGYYLADSTGANGGSGGGAGYDAYVASTVGSGTAGQGNNGGQNGATSGAGGGGGGGAGAVGSAPTNNPLHNGGNGGDGIAYTISGSSTYYGGGGGGGGSGVGGQGGGGSSVANVGQNGTANTGGGGGGAYAQAGVGGTGGSGIVIIRYPTETANLTTYYQELPADQNTVGLWHMNETAENSCSGGQDACDSSGNGRHGTATGTTIIDGKLNKARNFTGADDISIGSQTMVDSLTDVTVEAWIYPTAQTAATHFRAFTEEAVLYVGQYGNQISFYMGNGVGWLIQDTTGGTLPINQWSHVAWVKLGTTYYIYLNGQLVKTGSGAPATLGTTSNVNYISSYDGTNQPWTGSIDDMRISNVARTSEEIKLSAQRRPYSVYTSDVVDLGTVTSWTSLTWSELGVATGDGETLKDSTSLVAQWNFNEISGTTATNNAGSCGVSCNGTLTGFDSTASQDANATSTWTANNKRWGTGGLQFDGVDSRVDAGNNAALQITGNITLESWIKTSNTANYQRIVGKDDATNRDYGMETNITTGTVTGVVYIGNVAKIVTSATKVADGNWHHVVTTYDGSNVRMYVDGKQDGTPTAATGSIDNDTVTVSMGAYNAGTYVFKGVIDSTRIYSRALGASEIMSNYQAGNVELQTRVGADTSPDDGSWEAWKPTTGETAIDNMDNPLDYATPSATLYTGALVATSSATLPLIEGTKSLKVQTGRINSLTDTVGLWHLDETGGTGAYIKDSTTNANNGTPTGTTIVNGISNKGRNFNGSSDYVSSATPTAATTNWSVSAWINPANISQNGMFVNNGDGWGFSIGNCANGNGAKFCGFFGNVVWIDTGYTFASANQWYHVTMTRDSSTTRFYVNGVQTANTSASTPNAPSGNLYFGTRTGATIFFAGKIDEVQISNVVRSAEEIAEEYRAGRDHFINKTISSTDLSAKTSLPFYVAADRPGTYLSATVGESTFANYLPDANTKALIHMDEQSGSGAYIKDGSGNNNHGTPTGTTFTQGKIGKGRYFDNSNDVVDLGSPASLDFGNNGAFTHSGWINPATLGDYDAFVSKVVAARNGVYSYMTVFMANGRLSAYTGAAWVDICPAGSVTTGKWQHVAFDYNGTNISGYVNGALCGSAAFTYTDTAAHNVFIGSWYVTTQAYDFNGVIDEVTISNTARTADEIRQAYEVGLRTHPVTIDFGAKLDSGNLITGSGDLSFTVDATYYGLQNKGDMLFKGDKIIVRENYDGTEYIAQGTVTAVTASTGAVTVSAWDSGSTFPSGGYTVNASVFKWQREYWSVNNEALDSHIDGVTNLTLRLTNGAEGRTIWLDDLRSNSEYLTTPGGSTITSSTGNQYFQYRIIETSNDEAVSGSLASATIDYSSIAPIAPTIGSPTAQSATSIRWAFTDNSSNEDGFKVYDSSNNLVATCATPNISYCDETGLSVNTQYTRKVVAYRVVDSITYNSISSSTASKYTLANVPAAPAVSNRTATTIDVNPDPNSNPAATTMAIYKETGTACDGSGGSYIAANGSDNGATAVWQTDATWGTLSVTGLSADQGYAFCVKAKNGDDTETAFSSAGFYNVGYIPISGNYIYTTATANTSTFTTRYVDGNNASRYVLGVDNGGSPNTAIFEVQSGVLTINAVDTLVVGSMTLTGGSVAIADGGQIVIGQSLWAIDQDGDGYTLNNKLYYGNQPTNGRRKNLMTTLADDDCDDTNVNATTGNMSAWYQDSDADTYGNPNASQQSCLQPAGYVANNTDCYDSNANAKPGSTTCSSTNRGDGSWDYNCSGAAGGNACGTAYYVAAGVGGETYQSVVNRCVTYTCNTIGAQSACGASGYTNGGAGPCCEHSCGETCTYPTARGASGTQACQ